MHVSISDSDARPRTQAERRARTRAALLEAGARGFSRYGYGNLVLEKVAGEAGYTRGALYHLFAGKEDLAVAVVDWVADTWEREGESREYFERFSPAGYALGVNVVLYAMTH